MKSKISCFNKTIFKKNFTQFWPLWAAYLFYMIVAGPVYLYQRMNIYYDGEIPLRRQYSALASIFRNTADPVLMFIFSILAVMAVFSYLFTAKNANGIHSLPVTRWELFFTNFLSAFGFMTIIDIFVFVITVFIGINCNVTNIEVLFYALVYQIGITFFAVAFSVFVVMLTGSLFTMPIYCLIANYLYVGIWYIMGYLVEGLTYGMVYTWKNRLSYVLSPAYYMNGAVKAETHYNELIDTIEGITIHGGGVVAGYAIAAFAVLFVAYQLYKKRQLETAGDVISVSFMKPIFRFGTGIFGGLAGGMILSDILFSTITYSSEHFWGILGCSIFCGAIGFFGAEMLMQKNFRVFKRRIVMEAAVVFILMIGITGSLKLDFFGMEKALPEKEEVVKAYVNLDYPIKYEGEELEKLMELHNRIIAEKEENLAAQEQNQYTSHVEFNYHLADGTMFRRVYQIPMEAEDSENTDIIAAKILELELEPENMKEHLFGNNYASNQYLSGYIDLFDEYRNHFEYRFSEEEVKQITAALMKDLEEGNLGIYQIHSIYSSDINFFRNEIRLDFYNENGIVREEENYYNYTGTEMVTVETAASSVAFSDNVDMESVYLEFGPDCVNMVQTLEELGIINETWHLYTHTEYEALEINKK